MSAAENEPALGAGIIQTRGPATTKFFERVAPAARRGPYDAAVTAPEHPPDESERVAELRDLGILDTPPEERFDRYTRLASRLFGVPTALVSLVDSNRQWFKSRVGLDAPQTPRDVSFCGHAILNDDPLVINDAKEDPRFAQNPLVTGDPNIRFYVGAPLKGPSGHTLGTLCLIDSKPRTFDAADLRDLTDLASLVEGEFAALEAVSTDSLTGLTNRAGFRVLARRALAGAEARDVPVVMVFADLDGFKAINDVHGHAEGDEALKEFAGLLLTAFRDSDVIARLGGDEFCVLGTVRSPSDADFLTARVQNAVKQRNGDTDKPYALGVSLGHVLYDPERHRGVADLLAEADAKMYADKRRDAP